MFKPSSYLQHYISLFDRFQGTWESPPAVYRKNGGVTPQFSRCFFMSLHFFALFFGKLHKGTTHYTRKKSTQCCALTGGPGGRSPPGGGSGGRSPPASPCTTIFCQKNKKSQLNQLGKNKVDFWIRLRISTSFFLFYGPGASKNPKKKQKRQKKTNDFGRFRAQGVSWWVGAGRLARSVAWKKIKKTKKTQEKTK